MAGAMNHEVRTPGSLDDLPLGAFQVGTVLLVAATVVLDGLDNQMLGLAAPALVREWGVPRDALGLVFALGFVGMAIGTLAAGILGDRIGRRGALLAGVGLFGLATLATGFARQFWLVGLLKVVAGIGLGGVPGTASAMIAEFTPRRWRSLAVTFGVVCVSIGGVLGGLAAAVILPWLGWRWLFLLGGALTLVFTLGLVWLLPESPGFLATRPERRAQLDALLARLGAADVPPGSPSVPVTPPAKPEAGTSFASLLQPPLRRDSLALSMAMASGMFLIYLMFNWAPTLLVTAGFTLDTASLGLTSFNLGGTAGAMLAALVIMRVGSRPTLLAMSAAGMTVCLVLALGAPVLVPAAAHGSGAMLAGMGALGLFASAAQSAMFAVGAHAFPVPVRARGLGLMGAAGRAGALLSALAGAVLVGVGLSGFFAALVFVMLLNFVGFLAVRGHVPRLPCAVRKVA